MGSAELARLAQLAEARKAGALARLEALIAEARAREAEIGECRATAARDLAEGQLPPAQQALRLTWAEQRTAAARRRLTALAGEIAAARSAAIQELGKHAALEKLAARAEAEALRLRATRAEQDTPPSAPRT